MNRSYLFIPASNAGMILSSMILETDAIIFDLEDGVALNQKEAARTLLKNGLDTLDFLDKDIYVRVNAADSVFFKEDVLLCQHPKVHGIVLPKADMTSFLSLTKTLHPMKPTILLIESALGVVQLPQLCQASPHVIGLLLGGEDLSADFGVERTKEGHEIDLARKLVVIHAKAFNLIAIDTPYVDIEDHQGLKKEVRYAASLGYDAKVAINPRQVESIHQALQVDPKKLEEALSIVNAFEMNITQGIGVFNLNGKMIDEPIYRKAKQVVLKAKKEGHQA
jgi:citrate lyase subunit beta / citryl-CoA lyase